MSRQYFQVCIDGIDKSGKDCLWMMLDYLCNHNLVINVRGLLSNMSYDIIYNRNNNYDFNSYKNIVTIYTTVEEDDWCIRCKTTKEKDVKLSDYETHVNAFELSKSIMQNNGLIVLTYNTTRMTPYMIAMDILNRLKELNNED